MNPNDDEHKPADDKSMGEKVIETIDSVIDDAGEMMGGTTASKIAGGAAIGALAAVALPFSLVTGAAIGAMYSVWRQSNRPKL